MAKGAAFFVLVLALALVFMMDSAYSDTPAYEAGRKVKDTAHDAYNKAEDFFSGIFGRLVKHNHQHQQQIHVHGPVATPSPAPTPTPAPASASASAPAETQEAKTKTKAKEVKAKEGKAKAKAKAPSHV